MQSTQEEDDLGAPVASRGEGADAGERARRRARGRTRRGRSARRRTLDGGLDEGDDDEVEEEEEEEIEQNQEKKEGLATKSTPRAWDKPSRRLRSTSKTPTQRDRLGKTKRATPRKDSLGLDSVSAFWSTDRKSKGGSRRSRKLMLGDLNADDDDDDDDDDGFQDDNDDQPENYGQRGEVLQPDDDSSTEGGFTRPGPASTASVTSSPSRNWATVQPTLETQKPPGKNAILLISSSTAKDTGAMKEEPGSPSLATISAPNDGADDSDDSDALGIRKMISTSRQSPAPRPMAALQAPPPRSALRKSPRLKRSPRSQKSVRFSVQKVKQAASPLSPPTLQRSSATPSSVKKHRKSASRLTGGSLSSLRQKHGRLLRPEEQEDTLVTFGGENEENDAASSTGGEDTTPLEATNMLDILASTDIHSNDGEADDSASEPTIHSASSPSIALTPISRGSSSRSSLRSSTQRSRATPRTIETARSSASRRSRDIAVTPATSRSSVDSNAPYTGGAVSMSTMSSSSSSGRRGSLATPVSFSFRDAPGSEDTRRSGSARRDDDADENDEDGSEDNEDNLDASYRTAERKSRRIVEPVFDPSKDPVTPGRRRSLRKRWQTLDHWKGERLIQQRKRDKELGVYIDEVVGAEKSDSFVTPAPPKRRKKRRHDGTASSATSSRKKSKKEKENESNLFFEDAKPVKYPKGLVLQSSDISVTHRDPEGNTLMDSVVVRRAEDIELEEMPGDGDAHFTTLSGKRVAASNALAGAAFEDSRFISGVCDLPPLCCKPVEGSLGFTQVFIVSEAQPGAVVVQIENNSYKLSAGDHFWVPRHTSYGLRNFSETKRARVNFILVKPPIGPGDDAATDHSAESSSEAETSGAV